MPLLFLGDTLYDHDECPADLALLGRHFREHGYRVVLNLEGPLRGSRFDARRVVVLHHSESAGPALRSLQVVAVSLANNHVMDWGPEGFARTLDMLDGHGIGHFGAGADLEKAAALHVVEESGRRVGLLGFGWGMEGCVPATRSRPGVAPLRSGLVLDAIGRARPLVDSLVVCLHWGYEYELLPLPVHRQLARRAVEAGADLVIGHHPHVVQPMERHLGRSIYYSLGNFFFGSRRDDFAKLNPIAAKHSQLGMGVLLSFEPALRTSHLFFRYSAGQTRVEPEGAGVEDLSSIPMAAYNDHFRSRRTTTWKPSLYAGALHQPLNGAKLLRFAARRRLVRLAKASGAYGWLKRPK